MEIITKDKQYALELKERLEELSLVHETSFVDLAYALKDCIDNKVHAILDYKTFGEMVEKVLGFSERKGYMYAKVANTADFLGISRERLINNKASKILELMSLDPQEHGKQIRDLLDRSENLTVAEIKDKVKQIRAGDGQPTEYRTYKLAVEDAEQLDAAIELAKMNYGDTVSGDGEPEDISPSKAIAIIAQSYLQDPNNLGEN